MNWVEIRVPLTFSTLWYQWGLLTIVVVLCEGSKTGFRIFLSITKTSPGHFEVRGFTVVKSKNWPPLIFLKLKFSYINQGPWSCLYACLLNSKAKLSNSFIAQLWSIMKACTLTFQWWHWRIINTIMNQWFMFYLCLKYSFYLT